MEFTIATSPEQAIEMLEEAFQSGDLDAIMRLYDESVLVLPAPGVEERDIEKIRMMFAEVMRLGLTTRTEVSRVLVADNIAIYLSHWSLQMPDEPEQHFSATIVLRKHPEAGWRILIDNPRGTAVLHHA